MAKTNISITFLAKPSEKNADGLIPVYCRFKVNDSPKKEISANMRTKEENWDGEQQCFIPTKGMSKFDKELMQAQNQTLADMKTRLWEIFNQLVVANKSSQKAITAEMVKDVFMKRNENKTFMDAFLELGKAKTKTAKNKALGRAEIVCKHFNTFLLSEYKSNLLTDLEDKPTLSEDFHHYCTETLEWRGSYIKKMFYHLRNCFKIAKQKKWVSKEIELPYNFSDASYRLKEYLTSDELKKIKEKKMETPALERYKDLFLFQCYTGLSYADMKKIVYEDIKENDGSYFLRDFRQKTKVEYNIVILPQAMEIIEKYKEDSDRKINHPNHVLPVKANSNYNECLKDIMKACGIDKSISSHCARYTCNMLLFEAGVSDEVRKHILGHTTVAMTHHYTYKRPEVLLEAMNKIKI